MLCFLLDASAAQTLLSPAAPCQWCRESQEMLKAPSCGMAFLEKGLEKGPYPNPKVWGCPPPSHRAVHHHPGARAEQPDPPFVPSMSPFKMGLSKGLLVCRPFLVPNPESCARAVPAQHLLPGSAALSQCHSSGDRTSDLCHPPAQPGQQLLRGKAGQGSCLPSHCHQQDTKPGKATSSSSKGFCGRGTASAPSAGTCPRLGPSPANPVGTARLGAPGSRSAPSPAPVPNTVPWQHMEL